MTSREVESYVIALNNSVSWAAVKPINAKKARKKRKE